MTLESSKCLQCGAVFYTIPNHSVLGRALSAHNIPLYRGESYHPTAQTIDSGAEKHSCTRPTSTGQSDEPKAQTKNHGLDRTLAAVLRLGEGHVTTTSIHFQTPPLIEPATMASLSAGAQDCHPLPPVRPGSNLFSADRQEIGFYRSLIDR